MIKKKEPIKTNLESKNQLQKFWHWLWHSDSIWSWIVSLILAFIFIKFIFFPLLSLLMGTSLPLVVVESSSMEHPGSFFSSVFSTQKGFDLWWQEKGEWYESRGINKSQAHEWSLRGGFDKGDIMVVWGRFNPKIGDTIIFEASQTHPIIHRVIELNADKTLQTKGDNNSDQLSVEKSIQEKNIIGKAVLRIPKLGWIKLIFVEIGKVFSN